MELLDDVRRSTGRGLIAGSGDHCKDGSPFCSVPFNFFLAGEGSAGAGSQAGLSRSRVSPTIRTAAKSLSAWAAPPFPLRVQVYAARRHAPR